MRPLVVYYTKLLFLLSIDLRDCLENTDLRPFLTKTLKNVLETKLLHLGVNTTDILTAYIQGIRALRVLDPSGVLLEIVCEPVRKYLRTRDDTVRCIGKSIFQSRLCSLDGSQMKYHEQILNFYHEKNCHQR